MVFLLIFVETKFFKYRKALLIIKILIIFLLKSMGENNKEKYYFFLTFGSRLERFFFKF